MSKQADNTETWQRTCSWHANALQCHYPVGMFPEHATRGWGIFHRATGEGRPAAVIAEDSQGCPPEVYLERAKALMYGKGADVPRGFYPQAQEPGAEG